MYSHNILWHTKSNMSQIMPNHNFISLAFQRPKPNRRLFSIQRLGSKWDAFLLPYAIISQFPVSLDSQACLCYPECWISLRTPQVTDGIRQLRSHLIYKETNYKVVCDIWGNHNGGFKDHDQQHRSCCHQLVQGTKERRAYQSLGEKVLVWTRGPVGEQ